MYSDVTDTLNESPRRTDNRPLQSSENQEIMLLDRVVMDDDGNALFSHSSAVNSSQFKSIVAVPGGSDKYDRSVHDIEEEKVLLTDTRMTEMQVQEGINITEIMKTRDDLPSSVYD